VDEKTQWEGFGCLGLFVRCKWDCGNLRLSALKPLGVARGAREIWYRIVCIRIQIQFWKLNSRCKWDCGILKPSALKPLDVARGAREIWYRIVWIRTPIRVWDCLHVVSEIVEIWDRALWSPSTCLAGRAARGTRENSQWMVNFTVNDDVYCEWWLLLWMMTFTMDGDSCCGWQCLVEVVKHRHPNLLVLLHFSVIERSVAKSRCFRAHYLIIVRKIKTSSLPEQRRGASEYGM